MGNCQYEKSRTVHLDVLKLCRDRVLTDIHKDPKMRYLFIQEVAFIFAQARFDLTR